ncbi:MAG: hypothetical protein HQL87_12800 [Magnetococcales bacterium]|nr:hypothetical protein [Magnetococcales bacterium]
MREQHCGETRWEGQTMEQWPSGRSTNGSERALAGSQAEAQDRAPVPLTPLSLDTILTAGDLQRILKIVSSA